MSTVPAGTYRQLLPVRCLFYFIISLGMFSLSVACFFVNTSLISRVNMHSNVFIIRLKVFLSQLFSHFTVHGCS